MLNDLIFFRIMLIFSFSVYPLFQFYDKLIAFDSSFILNFYCMFASLAPSSLLSTLPWSPFFSVTLSSLFFPHLFYSLFSSTPSSLLSTLSWSSFFSVTLSSLFFPHLFYSLFSSTPSSLISSTECHLFAQAASLLSGIQHSICCIIDNTYQVIGSIGTE